MPTERKALTPRRREIWGFMCRFQERNGFAPTAEEVALQFGISKITAYETMRMLVTLGWCREVGSKGTSRRIEAIDEEEAFTLEQVKQAVIEYAQKRGHAYVAACEIANEVEERLTVKAATEAMRP